MKKKVNWLKEKLGMAYRVLTVPVVVAFFISLIYGLFWACSRLYGSVKDLMGVLLPWIGKNYLTLLIVWIFLIAVTWARGSTSFKESIEKRKREKQEREEQEKMRKAQAEEEARLRRIQEEEVLRRRRAEAEARAEEERRRAEAEAARKARIDEIAARLANMSDEQLAEAEAFSGQPENTVLFDEP